MEDLPEGVYVDKEAIDKETSKAVQIIINEVVSNLHDQTLLIQATDMDYARKGVPMFIREQASQRLGDVLLDLTITPIITKILNICTDEPRE